MAKSDGIKILAEKTGKSIDEIKDFLNKIFSGARDIDMGDIKSPPMKRGRPSKTPVQSPAINPNEIDVGNIDPIAIKKGRPAKSPFTDPNEIDLGKSKGKLEIGDSPSSPVSVNEIDMGDISPINPNIDDYRVPYKSTGIDAVGGNKAPSVVNNMTDMIDDMAGPITSRKTTIPTEVGPQVLGKGTSRVAGKADNIVDAEMIDKVNKMPEGPLKTAALKKLGLLGLGTAAVAGGLSLLSDDGKSPSADFSPVAINGMPNQKSVSSNEKSTLTGEKESATQKEQGVPVESLGEQLKSEQTREPSSDRLSYMDMMQNAQQAASQNRLQAALLKAGMQAGAAIAGPGVKADTSMADALAEAAGTPVSNIKGLMETEVSAKKLKQLEEEMTDEAKMRDPNSEISKMIASAAIKAGLIKSGTKISAATLNKSGLNLTAILNAQENARNRAANIELNRQNKLFDEEKARREKLEDLERKYEEQKKEKVAPLEASRLNLKRNIQEYIDLVDSTKGGVGTGELFGPVQKRMVDLQTQIATDQAKMADPTSSAMQGEVEKYRAGLPAIGTFVPETEATALAILKKHLADVDKRALAGYVARGIKPDPTLYKSQSTDLTTSSGNTREFKQSYAPGTIVTTKSGSYQIGADGKTGTKLNE